MATPTSYASALQARDARLEELRLRRRASRTEALVHAAVLAAALATLAMVLDDALHTGARQVISSLDAATSVHSVQ
jgi:hypothetical protein